MGKDLFTGWYDKKNLHVWDEEDTDNLYRCGWIKSFNLTTKFKNDRERKRYYNDLYDRLVQTLPEKDLQEMNNDLKGCSRILNRDKYEKIIRYTITKTRSRLLAHDYQKQKILENKSTTNTNTDFQTTFNKFRAQQLVNGDQKNNDNPIGYYPTMEVLLKLPPMEIIDYVGFRLIKYDKFKGYYAIILRYPKDLYKEPDILYGENASALESEAEYKFDNEVNKYLAMKANPYGDKVYSNVDISNVEQVMSGNNNVNINPLDIDIF